MRSRPRKTAKPRGQPAVRKYTPRPARQTRVSPALDSNPWAGAPADYTLNPLVAPYPQYPPQYPPQHPQYPPQYPPTYTVGPQGAIQHADPYGQAAYMNPYTTPPTIQAMPLAGGNEGLVVNNPWDGDYNVYYVNSDGGGNRGQGAVGVSGDLLKNTDWTGLIQQGAGVLLGAGAGVGILNNSENIISTIKGGMQLMGYVK